MKKFSVPVIYSFAAFFIVKADSAAEAEQIVKDKVKVSPGAVLTNSIAIEGKEVSEILCKFKDTIEITTKDET